MGLLERVEVLRNSVNLYFILYSWSHEVCCRSVILVDSKTYNNSNVFIKLQLVVPWVVWYWLAYRTISPWGRGSMVRLCRLLLSGWSRHTLQRFNSLYDSVDKVAEEAFHFAKLQNDVDSLREDLMISPTEMVFIVPAGVPRLVGDL